jgi:hypothetical protein
MEMNSFKHIGHPKHFPWPHLPRDEWPGRELFWAWEHPATTALILLGAVGELGAYIVSLG